MKRILSLLLTCAMLLGMVTVGVFADDISGSDGAASETTALTYNGTTMKAYRAWSTVDSRWATMKLGTSTSTVKTSGSLVVALTKVMIQAGLWKDGEADPTDGKTVADMVELLNSKNTFTSSGALYWWQAAQALGLTDQGQKLGTKTEVAKELEQIISWEKQGYHLLICVETTYGSHWLAVDEGMTLGMNDGEVYVMDGDPNTNIDRYPLLTDYTYIKEIHAYSGGTTHTHNLEKQVTAATCTENGITTYFCPDDGEGYYTDWVEALGHNYKETVTEPTCVDQGYTVYTCQRCGDIYKGDYVPAKGHTSTAVVTAPTCTEDGYTTYTCTVCGYTYKDHTVAALGHNFVKSAVIPATETTSGYTIYTCSRCGATEDRDLVDPHTHVWGEWTVTASSAAAYGTKARTCSVCGYTETAKLEYLNPFTDVGTNIYYSYPVLWAVNQDPQITNGTSPTTFTPNSNCTRGQIVTFLWRAAGCPEPTTSENPYTDVTADSYYYKAVLWAVENGITNGTSPTTFTPNSSCTRGQAVTFLWRAAGSPEPDTSANPYTDVDTESYYYKAVLWAVQKSVTNGMSPTTFGPEKFCTRGQIVTFLYRAKKL